MGRRHWRVLTPNPDQATVQKILKQAEQPERRTGRVPFWAS